MSTPYDGKIGLVFWTGQSVGEDSIEAVAETIVRWAPNVKAVYVKTSDGDVWQGTYDNKRVMAIHGPDDIARWVSVLTAYGLEFHGWCVLTGRNVPEEADKVVAACQVEGVHSMLLDVEDGPQYFSGGAGDARHLIQRIALGAPDGFHLGLNFDARGDHPRHIHIDQWLPHVGSLHPMVYHKEFGVSVDRALVNAFRACDQYGLPVYPMLQAYGGVAAADLERGAALTFGRHDAGGVSYFRLGTIGPAEFRAIASVRIPTGLLPEDGVGEPPMPVVSVSPAEPGYTDGLFHGLNPATAWRTFRDVHGRLVKYKETANPQEAYARYRPALPGKSRYAVEAFIPDRHATTRRALYHIVHRQGGRRVETKATVDQSVYFNDWALLGMFELDPNLPGDGRVDLVDFSTEQPERQVAFAAIRWRPVSGGRPAIIIGAADGFDSPVGSAAERRGDRIWPGRWVDATGFGTPYRDSAGNISYHTGADLNWNYPTWNLDRGQPVYAVASGVVTWAGRLGDYWRNVIVIRHDPLPDGTRVCSRYGHVERLQVKKGERVQRGEQIATVGASGGRWGNYHLHFDISPTDVLEDNPGHWPGMNLSSLRAHYADPRLFIRRERP